MINEETSHIAFSRSPYFWLKWTRWISDAKGWKNKIKPGYLAKYDVFIKKIPLIRDRSHYQIGWIFGKAPKGGRGPFSIQKFILQILGTLNRPFWAWNWYKNSKFRVQAMFFQQLYWERSKQDTLWRRHVHAFHTLWPSYLVAYMQPYPLQKISNIIFQKMRGEDYVAIMLQIFWPKGRLEFFQKIIRFGSGILP